MRVLLLITITDTQDIEGIYANADSAWGDFLDLIEYAGADVDSFEEEWSKEDIQKMGTGPEDVCRYDGDGVSVYLEWHEVKS